MKGVLAKVLAALKRRPKPPKQQWPGWGTAAPGSRDPASGAWGMFPWGLPSP